MPIFDLSNQQESDSDLTGIQQIILLEIFNEAIILILQKCSASYKKLKKTMLNFPQGTLKLW